MFQYAAAYPEEISCLVALDAILSGERSSKPIWKTIAHRIDGNLEFYKRPVKIRKEELTYEKAMDLYECLFSCNHSIRIVFFSSEYGVLELELTMKQQNYFQNDRFVETKVCFLNFHLSMFVSFRWFLDNRLHFTRDEALRNVCF